MFHVGQKVECIAGPFRDSVDAMILHDAPKIGRVYVVAEINDGFLGLVEFCNSDWDPRAFRPIVEKKTDISVFTAMLTPTEIKIKQNEQV
jgi:hypothetical protein